MNKSKKPTSGSSGSTSNQFNQSSKTTNIKSFSAAVSSSAGGVNNSAPPAPGLSKSINNNDAVNQIQAYVLSLSDNDQIAHRTAYLQFLHVLSGAQVSMELTDGTSVEGTYYTSTPFKSKEYLVAVKVNQPGNGSENNTSLKQSIKIANKDTFQSLRVPSIDLTSKNATPDLRIDSSISNRNISHLDGRNLEQVSSSWLQPDKMTSLGTGNLGDWNQFEVNKRLFNVASSFDENLYTSKLDITKMSKEMIADAERKAKEIEGSFSTNIHILEERGQKQEKEIDEEDLYSGVLREEPTPIVSTQQGKDNVWKRAMSTAVMTAKPSNNFPNSKFKNDKNEKKVVLEKSKPILSDKTSSMNVAPSSVNNQHVIEAVVVGDVEVVISNSEPTVVEPEVITSDSNVAENTSEEKEAVENSNGTSINTNESNVEIEKEKAIEQPRQESNVSSKTIEETTKPTTKSFSFNPKVADFVPGGGSTSSIAVTQQQPQYPYAEGQSQMYPPFYQPANIYPLQQIQGMPGQLVYPTHDFMYSYGVNQIPTQPPAFANSPNHVPMSVMQTGSPYLQPQQVFPYQQYQSQGMFLPPPQQQAIPLPGTYANVSPQQYMNNRPIGQTQEGRGGRYSRGGRGNSGRYSNNNSGSSNNLNNRNPTP